MVKPKGCSHWRLPLPCPLAHRQLDPEDMDDEAAIRAVSAYPRLSVVSV